MEHSFKKRIEKLKNTNIEDAAMIVSSPFQALCAIEAINLFKIKRPVFYVQGSGIGNDMTRDFLKEQGYKIVIIEETYKAINVILKYGHHKKYQYIFVGDYFSAGDFLLSTLWTKFAADIIYLDDGNSTLSILPPVCRKRLNNGSIIKRLYYRVFLLYKDIKHVHRTFFSFYDLENEAFPYPVINNSFLELRHGFQCVEPSDIYIIGTNTSSIGWSSDAYEEYLKIIKLYAAKKYPNSIIYYCPHRRDQNAYDIECAHQGIEIYRTKISVEVDFVSSGIYPKVIFGFGSTAMLTIKKIFPNTIVVDFIFHCSNPDLVAEYRPIEKVYHENGIKVMEIDKLNKQECLD